MRVSWNDLYENFKRLYPRLGRESVRFQPADYMTIVVYCSDGTKILYDDFKKRARITN